MIPIVRVLFLCLFVTACGASSHPPAVNTTGTPTNASEQIAGAGYEAYIAADAAWLAYLKLPHPDRALVAKVEPVRKAARTALDKFALASVNGNAAAERAAFTAALEAYQSTLSSNGVK